MTITRCFCPLIALALACSQSSATNYHEEDRYNPQHIERLPPEIRDWISRRCAEPKALHEFTSYFDEERRIVLHYEHFLCDGDRGPAYCTPEVCLHQVWTAAGGHYRLMRSYYAPRGE
jgi:hypothetical protein